MDECAEPSLNNCEAGSECRNYDGGYECICDDGRPAQNGVCGDAMEPGQLQLVSLLDVFAELIQTLICGSHGMNYSIEHV